MIKGLRFGLAVMAGAALVLGQAPYNFPYLAVIALPMLLWLLQKARGRKGGFALGWGAGLGYFGLTLTWIMQPFLVDAARYGWMAPFALGLMAGGLALFWGLGYALAQPRANALVLAGFWTLAELLRAYIFTGFPWALMAYNWVETPIIQAVSVVSVHGLGFLIVLAGGWLLSKRTAVLSVLIAASLAGFGFYRLHTPVEDTGLTVRLIQPNAIQSQKWDPEFIPVFYQRQLTLSASVGRPDVVIWPEAAIAYLPDEQPFVRRQIATAAQAPVILGARRRDADGVYNSLFLLNKDSSIAAVYDKYHLVPFGEYMPLQGLAKRLGLKALAAQMGPGDSFGSGPKILQSEAVPPFLPLICYEAIFPQGVAGPRPAWLVQITNDAWFGTRSGPYQHLAQARVRAIEQGLPLARAANTGISAMIDPLGRITKSLPLGVDGYMDAPLAKPLPPTLLARWGQWPVIGVIILLLAAGMALSRPRAFRY
jgi:apolipoprotein N-acyltransferase